MKKAIFSMIFLIIFWTGAIAQMDNSSISEGPYIYFEKGEFRAKWIRNGAISTSDQLTADFLKKEFGLALDPEVFNKNIKAVPVAVQEYEDVPKFAVLSDIHGQYPLMVALLKNHGIIDGNLNWIFGEGQLVINGDIMGRGNMVTEALWLAYKLESKAAQAGGKVHFLLGNHELMVVNSDFRYLNEKYTNASSLMGISNSELYGNNTVLGNWLRKRPAMIKIDDFLITHAGVSPQFLKRKLTANEVNKVFYEEILNPRFGQKQRNNGLIRFLNGPDGPIWYRGYFIESDISTKRLDDILTHLESKHIVVGHTSLDSITALFGGRVIGVDSSIKNGRGGEILIVENGRTYRGTLDGRRILLDLNP